MGKLEKSQKILLTIGIVAVVLSIALFVCFRLPVCQFDSDAMKDRGHFDEKIYYDESYVIETANLMTDADVQSNIYYTSIDFAFVTCYFFAMVFLIVPTLKKKVKWIGVCIPLIAAIFDMLENVSIMLVLHKNFALAPCMGAFTALKWVGTLMWTILAVTLAIYEIVKVAKERYNANTERIEKRAKKLYETRAFKKAYRRYSYKHNRFYNIESFAKEFDKTFAEAPFSDADSLILCQLAYMDLDKVTGVSVCDVLKTAKEKNIPTEKIAPYCHDDCVKILKALEGSRRFAQVKIVDARYALSTDDSCQFGIVLFDLGDFVYIACRGTDDHMIGWLEDVDLIHLDELKSHELTVKAISDYAKMTDKPIILGGHSKGGNMAVYGASFVDKAIKKRILKIYDHDGPGIRRELTDASEFYLISHKIDKTCPEFSVFGMVLINSREYRTIYSHCLGIWQHYTFNWQINKNDGSFVLAERTNHASMTIRLVIEKVLPTMTMDDRRRFRYLVARALDGAGVFVLDDFSVKKIIRMFKVWGCQPWSEQKFLWSILFKVLKAIPSCQRKATRENKYSDKATKSYFWLKKHGCKIVLDHNGVKRVVSDKTEEQKKLKKQKRV